MKRVILRFSVLESWRYLGNLRATLMLALMISSSLAYSQTVVRGKIIDEAGVALPGVNVLVKGSTVGTTSDANGSYSLEVSGENTVLVYSFIGYETQEATVGGRSVIDISLVPSIESLAEVVVVGYGVQRQESITGSVASINGDMMREIPAANFSQALQGRLAGVEMSQTSTRPGAAMQIRIRGTRSLIASNDPLICT